MRGTDEIGTQVPSCCLDMPYGILVQRHDGTNESTGAIRR